MPYQRLSSTELKSAFIPKRVLAKYRKRRVANSATWWSGSFADYCAAPE
jgi:hypothetical protein